MREVLISKTNKSAGTVSLGLDMVDDNIVSGTVTGERMPRSALYCRWKELLILEKGAEVERTMDVGAAGVRSESNSELVVDEVAGVSTRNVTVRVVGSSEVAGP
jgi:hypothetical protein